MELHNSVIEHAFCDTLENCGHDKKEKKEKKKKDLYFYSPSYGKKKTGKTMPDTVRGK